MSSIVAALSSGGIDVKGEIIGILEFLSGLSEKHKPTCVVVIMERWELQNVPLWLELWLEHRRMFPFLKTICREHVRSEPLPRAPVTTMFCLCASPSPSPSTEEANFLWANHEQACSHTQTLSCKRARATAIACGDSHHATLSFNQSTCGKEIACSSLDARFAPSS